MKRLLFTLGMLLALRDTAAASGDLFDVLKELNIQRNNAAGVQQLINSPAYAATVNMLLLDRDPTPNNTNFSNSDLMQSLTLRGRGGSLTFPIGSRTVIENFAKAHAKEILDILFPGGFGANTLGTTESQLSSSLTFDEIVAPLSSSSGQTTVQLRDLRNELSGRIEVSDLEINRDNGYSIGGLLGFQHWFGPRLRIGFLLPYRFTSLEDSIGTTAHFVQFDPFVKYLLYDGPVQISIGGDGFVSGLLDQSKAVKYFGNLTYGGGGFASIERQLPWCIVTAGLGFKVSQRTVGFSRHKDDFASAILDAINHRALDKDFTYGLNIGVPLFQESLVLNVGVHRINSFGADVPSESDSLTKVRIVGQYHLSQRFELNAGYSTILELADTNDHIFFLSAVSRF